MATVHPLHTTIVFVPGSLDQVSDDSAQCAHFDNKIRQVSPQILNKVNKFLIISAELRGSSDDNWGTNHDRNDVRRDTFILRIYAQFMYMYASDSFG